MADLPISSLGALGAAPATNDLFVTVDVSDSTQAPTGTTKKMTVANLFTAPAFTGAVTSAGTINGQTISSSAAFTGTLTVATGIGVTSGGLSVAGGFSVTSGSAAFAGPTTFSGMITAGAGFTVNGGAVSLTATDVTSNFSVATNKFTVAAASGNTVIAGTLAVTGTITGTLATAAQANITSVGTLTSLTVSGAVSTGALDATGNFSVATNKVTVASSTGNTTIAGTLITAGGIQSTAGGLSIFGSATFGGDISTFGNFTTASTGVYQILGTQVVGARKTGWTSPTGTATRTTFATSSVTLPVLAEHVMALIVDLTSHGLIGT